MAQNSPVNSSSSTKRERRISSRKHGKSFDLCPHLKKACLSYPTAAFREDYIAPIPEAERKDMILAYHAQLNSTDDDTRRIAAAAWSKWEQVPACVEPTKSSADRISKDANF